MFSNLKEVISQNASIMAGVTSTRIPPRVAFLAEFQDDQLKLNTETLSLLTGGPQGRRTDNPVPVTIVSVIGPPNSKKTSTMNSICHLLIPEVFHGKGKTTLKVFPDKVDCESNDYFNFLRGKDAVLVTIPPINPPKQNSITDEDRIILLDIWSWEPSPERYSKMVDFCIKASTVAVYVNLIREEKTGIWIRSAPSLEKPHLYFSRFFLLTQTRATDDSDETGKLPEVCDIISKPFQITTVVKFQNLGDDFREARKGKSKNYFTEIRNTTMSNKCRNSIDLQNYFRSCIDLKTNSAHPSTSSTETVNISSSNAKTSEEFSRTDVEDPMRTFTVMETLQNAYTDKAAASDGPVVMENAKNHGEQPSQLLPLPSEALDLYWNKMTGSYLATKSLFLHRQEIKANHDNIMSKNIKADTSVYADEDITVLCDHFYAFHSMMQDLCCQVREECAWKTKATLDSIYTSYIRDILRFSPENDTNSFKTLSFVLQSFTENLQRYEDSFENKKIQNCNLHAFSKQLTAIAGDCLKTLRQESVLADKAAREASVLFGHTTEKLLGFNPWPDNQLRQVLRQTACLFDKQYSATYGNEVHTKLVWKISRLNLSIMMKTHARDVISGNQVRITDLDHLFERVLQSCYQYYQIRMNGELPQHNIPTERLKEMSKAYREASRMKLCDESGKDVNSNILKYWWTCLDVQLAKAEAKILKENEAKPDYCPQVHFEISRTTPRSSIAEEPLPQKEMPSLGIHVGPDIVQIGVYNSEFETFRKNIIAQHPFIAFRNGKIIVGKEAKPEHTEDPTCFNISYIISHPDRSRKQEIMLDGKSFILTENEAVALFFTELLKEVEKKFEEKFRTCVIVASNLLPSAGRQTLRQIMSIAGFTRVIFIPTTAAMALSLLKKIDETPQTKPLKAMCIHYAGRTLEIAKVKITSEEIHVKQTEGYLNFEKTVKETYNGFTSLAVKKIIQRISGKRKPFEAVLVNKGYFSFKSITEFLSNPKEFNYEATSLQPDSLLFTAAMLDAHGGHTYSNRKISYNVPYSLSMNGKVHNFPRGPNDFATIEKLSGKSEAVETFVISEGICHPDGHVKPKWNYQFKVAPPGPCSEIELAMTANGCFKLLSRDDGYTINSTCCKFLTAMDMRSLEVILENIEKHRSCNGEDAMDEIRNELRQIVEKVELSLQEKASTYENYSAEAVRVINDHIRLCKSLLDTKTANKLRIRIALKQLLDIAKDFI